MKDALLYMVQHIALNPDEISIEQEENENEVTFYIKCADEDMGRIIGKEGKVIKSLRRILTIIAIKEGKRVTISMVDANPSEESTSAEE